MSELNERAAASEPLCAVRAALAGEPDVWIVGGALRDLLLDRPVTDVDLAVGGDAKRIAQRLHGVIGGDIFSLSDRFGTWRVIDPAGKWNADLSALRGESIEADLALRDFTVNAMAMPLAGDGELVDPAEGAADLAAGRLRAVSDGAFADDPLRVLRSVRFAAALELELEDRTARLTRTYVPELASVSPERIFSELKAIVTGVNALAGIRNLAQLEVDQMVLPELAGLKGVEQSKYHHLDAYEHTLEVFAQMTWLLGGGIAQLFGEDAAQVLDQLRRPLADQLTAAETLLFGALLHDIGKRDTRTVFDDGRVGFPGHDERGAEMTKALCKRWHTSDRLSGCLSALTRHHLVLGFMVHRRPLNKLDHYRYLKLCAPVELEVTVLSVADRLATRGSNAEEAIDLHVGLAREIISAALDWREQGPPAALLPGDELAALLGITPGPQLGRLIEVVAEAQYVGAVTTKDEAVAAARRELANAQLET